MIVITGATGKLGRLVVAKLAKLLPTKEIGVSVRDKSKATELVELGIRVRESDFANRDSLRHAFEGASQVLIISVNSTGPEAVQIHKNAIDVAKEVGAERVLYSSHMGSNLSSHFSPMRDHAEDEQALKASGLRFCSLRNGFYASSALMMMGEFRTSGKVIAPADGPVSWTTHEDLADAAVIAITDPKKLDGITPPLTGSEALNLEQLSRIASEVFDRRIERVVITEDEHRNEMTAKGFPEHVVQLLEGLFKASHDNEFTQVDNTLQRILGRPPQTMQQVIAQLLVE